VKHLSIIFNVNPTNEKAKIYQDIKRGKTRNPPLFKSRRYPSEKINFAKVKGKISTPGAIEKSQKDLINSIRRLPN